MKRRIIEISIEVEGDFEDDVEEIAEELESYTEQMIPMAYRVSAYVGRDEEI